eukprot:c11515_g1_i1.p1 GENE.c11515_g1_i1~~c11515_g1_i1.p1  ORF type:complete len:128 (-),score=67.89 c11515_g1_i1:32-415(-)
MDDEMDGNFGESKMEIETDLTNGWSDEEQESQTSSWRMSQNRSTATADYQREPLFSPVLHRVPQENRELKRPRFKNDLRFQSAPEVDEGGKETVVSRSEILKRRTVTEAPKKVARRLSDSDATFSHS